MSVISKEFSANHLRACSLSSDRTSRVHLATTVGVVAGVRKCNHTKPRGEASRSLPGTIYCYYTGLVSAKNLLSNFSCVPIVVALYFMQRKSRSLMALSNY